MNPRAILAGLLGGVVMWLVGFLLHGVIMAPAYVKYPEVFTQESSHPLWFLLIEILIAVPAAVIFTRTRAGWEAGVAGGVTFGFWLGLVAGFAQFYKPLTLDGFPYYLAWCSWGISLITMLALGAVLGAMVKPPAAS